MHKDRRTTEEPHQRQNHHDNHQPQQQPHNDQSKNRFFGRPSATHLRRFSIISQLGLLMDTPPPSLLLKYLIEAIVLTILYLIFLYKVSQQYSQFNIYNTKQEDWEEKSIDVWLSVPVYGTVLYISFVILGRNFMETRPPISARVFEGMVAFNGYQIVLNLLCFATILNEFFTKNLKLWGNQIPTSSPTLPSSTPSTHTMTLTLLLWINYSNKYIELLDTIFTVLRKKFTHVSFLHVYQRIVLVWLWFFICRMECGGDYYFGALLNFFINIISYSYYFLSLIGVHFPSSLKYKIADLHILQYILCTVHSVLMIVDVVVNEGERSVLLASFQLVVNFTMLVLFTNFHYENYEKGYGRSGENGKKKVGEDKARLIFSFDSSGWLYMYHFGIAKFVEANIVNDKDPKSQSVGYSGSSGGSLVAAALASKVNIFDLATYVISQRENCKINPWKILPAAEKALDKFLKEDAHVYCTDRLRVLVTKLTTKPPFLMGEVKSNFNTRSELWHALRASCHVPLIGGLLPYIYSQGYYYDGLFWSNNLSFVPWRSFSDTDQVIKSSSVSNLNSDIKPRIFKIFPFPPWWSLFPPTEAILQGMAARGFEDAKGFFVRNHKGLNVQLDVERCRRSYWKGKEFDEEVIAIMERAVWKSWATFGGLLLLSVCGVILWAYILQ